MRKLMISGADLLFALDFLEAVRYLKGWRRYQHGMKWCKPEDIAIPRKWDLDKVHDVVGRYIVSADFDFDRPTSTDGHLHTEDCLYLGDRMEAMHNLLRTGEGNLDQVRFDPDVIIEEVRKSSPFGACDSFVKVSRAIRRIFEAVSAHEITEEMMKEPEAVPLATT